MSTFELLREFNQFGCPDQTKIALACRVYQHLLTTKNYKNLDKIYVQDLGVFFIIAYDSSTSDRHIFLPLLSTQNLDMLEVERLQTKLKEVYDECTIHLSICDTASNILFYTISAGFLDNEVNFPRKR